MIRTERSYENQLCAIFDRIGVPYERQKRVNTGVIDILVYCRHSPTIIEVKRDGSPRNLMQAILQLRFYATGFNESRLFIATPKCIDVRFRPILQSYNVGEISGIVLDEGEISPELVDFPKITRITSGAELARS